MATDFVVGQALTKTMSHSNNDDLMREIFLTTKTIACVGLSPRLDRASHSIASYLKSLGYHIIAVNPATDKVIGFPELYPTLAEIPNKIELVQIFRRSENVPPIVEDAIARGAKYVWMQIGVAHGDAAARARAAGLQVVMNRCMLQEHRRLFGEKFVTW